MSNSSLRRSWLFTAVSVIAGIAMAVSAIRLWPQLIRSSGPQQVAAASGADPEALELPAAQREMSADAASPDSAETDARAAPALQAGALESQAVNGSFSSAVRASAPAVVSIFTTQRVDRQPASPLEQLFGNPSQPRYLQSLGSGVIVDQQGHIVTNDHVVKASLQTSVQLADGRSTVATLVGSDPDTDLAVLKIDLPNLPVMKLGRADRVSVGDIVLAIGNPFGLTQTVTHGIVSGTGRADLNIATYEDFIQTDAAINEGNSGGALVDTRGELIGINTAVLGKDQGAEGIGVAIPVDLVRGVVRDILANGRVIRGWIGIQAEDVSPQLARAWGLPRAGVVINVYRGSPALAAGLAGGDMIETIEGQPVKSAQDLRARIADHKPGGRVRIVALRGAQKLDVEMPVIEAPRLRQP
jgi:serine protease DegS